MATRGPLRLNPSTPAGYAEMLIRGRIDRARALSASGDTGASVIEWVIITAILLAVALTVGGVIVNKINNKADELELDTTITDTGP